MTISVKVMLSYDYNHIRELSRKKTQILLPAEVVTIFEVNKLRKRAQRLADEAVRQYRVAKDSEFQRIGRTNEFNRLVCEVEGIRMHPSSEWTAEQKAKVKALDDKEYWDAFSYDYDDDPDNIEHW